MTTARLLVICLALLVFSFGGCRMPGGGSSAPPGVAGPSSQPGPPPPVWGCVILTAEGLTWLPDKEPFLPRVFAPDSADQYDARAVISPDKRQVAYLTVKHAVKVYDLVTGRARELAAPLPEPPDARGALSWSPDSKLLAVIEKGNIIVLAQGGPRRVLTTQGGVTTVGWSPDGRRLAYGRRDEQDRDLGLWVISAQGGQPTQLVKSNEDVFAASYPLWSPNGQWLAFLHSWEGGALCLVRPDGQDYQKDLGSAWIPMIWTGDSKQIVCSAVEDEVTMGGVSSCVPGAKPNLFLNRPVASFDLLPDGRLLTLEETPEGSQARGLWLRRYPSVGAVKADWALTMEGNSGECKWRPDGRKAAVWIQQENDRGVLWLGAVGGNLAQAHSSTLLLIGWAQASPPRP